MAFARLNAASENMSSIQDQLRLIHTPMHAEEPCQTDYMVASFYLEEQRSFFNNRVPKNFLAKELLETIGYYCYWIDHVHEI